MRYVVDGVRYEREMFTSFPDQVAVVRLTASERWRISFRTSFATPMDNYRVTASGDNRLLIDGRTDGHETIPGMVRYRTVAEILPEGGKAVADSVGITVTDADAVTILVSVATNFNDYRDISGTGRVLSVGCEEKALFPAESRPHRGLPSVDRTGIARFGNERSGR